MSFWQFLQANWSELFLHDRHRDFSEVVEHEIVDWSTFDLAHWRVKEISPESLTCGYTYFFFHSELWNLSDDTQKHKKGSPQERR